MQSKKFQVLFFAGTLLSSEVDGITIFWKTKSKGSEPEAQEPQFNEANLSPVVREHLRSCRQKAAQAEGSENSRNSEAEVDERQTLPSMLDGVKKEEDKVRVGQASCEDDLVSPNTDHTTAVPTFDDGIPLRYTINVEQLERFGGICGWFKWAFGWKEWYNAEVSLGEVKEQVRFRYSELKNRYEALKQESPQLYSAEFPERPTSGGSTRSWHSDRVRDMHNIFNEFFKSNPDVTEALFPINGQKSLFTVFKEIEQEHDKLSGKCKGPVREAISIFQTYTKEQNIEPEMSKQLSQILPKFRASTLMVVEKDLILEQLLEEMRELFGNKGDMFKTIEFQIGGYRDEVFTPFYNKLVTNAQESNFEAIHQLLDGATENLKQFESKINLEKFRGFFNKTNIDSMIALRELQGDVLVKLKVELYPEMFGMDSEVHPDALNDFLGKRMILDHFSKNWDFKHPETWPEPSSFSSELARKKQELKEVLDWTPDNKPDDDKFKTNLQMIQLRELQKTVMPKLYELCPDVFGTGDHCVDPVALRDFLGKDMLSPETDLFPGQLALKIEQLEKVLELKPHNTQDVADLKQHIVGN